MDFFGLLVETLKNSEKVNEYLLSPDGKYYLGEISKLETKITEAQDNIELNLKVEENEKKIVQYKTLLKNIVNDFTVQVPALSKFTI